MRASDPVNWVTTYLCGVRLSCACRKASQEDCRGTRQYNFMGQEAFVAKFEFNVGIPKRNEFFDFEKGIRTYPCY